MSDRGKPGQDQHGALRLIWSGAHSASTSDRAVLAVLVRYRSRATGLICPSIATIAEAAGMSKQGAQNAIDRLHHAKVVDYEEARGKRKRKYTIHLENLSNLKGRSVPSARTANLKRSVPSDRTRAAKLASHTVDVGVPSGGTLASHPVGPISSCEQLFEQQTDSSLAAKCTQENSAQRNWVAQAGEVWARHTDGVVAPGRIGSALKPIVERHGVERTLELLAGYLRACDDLKYASPAKFAEAPTAHLKAKKKAGTQDWEYRMPLPWKEQTGAINGSDRKFEPPGRNLNRRNNWPAPGGDDA
jgi:hypothetical protein